jgi:hypothetical protein
MGAALSQCGVFILPNKINTKGQIGDISSSQTQTPNVVKSTCCSDRHGFIMESSHIMVGNYQINTAHGNIYYEYKSGYLVILENSPIPCLRGAEVNYSEECYQKMIASDTGDHIDVKFEIVWRDGEDPIENTAYYIVVYLAHESFSPDFQCGIDPYTHIPSCLLCKDK